MAKKKSKLATPDWILEGYDSKADWEKAHGIKEEKKKGKIFKIKICPKCGSDDVNVVLSQSNSEEGGGEEWQCNACGWHGPNIKEKELTEDQLMKYMDEKGEDIA